MTDPPALDTTDEVFGSVPAAVVAEALGVRRSTLATWRRLGKGPPFMRLGRLLTVYPVGGFYRWWSSPGASRHRRRRLRHARLAPR